MSEHEGGPGRQKGKIRTFRDLIAWQKAMGLAGLVYRETKRLPREEQFGLISQMRRAAVSVPSNIAEGFARQRKADYLKHLRFARASLAELDTQYELATEILGLAPRNAALLELLSEADRVLQGLIRSLED